MLSDELHCEYKINNTMFCSIYINLIYKLLIYDLMGLYIYIRFFKKILSYYFIYLYYILNMLNSESKKIINLTYLLIYRVFTVVKKIIT